MKISLPISLIVEFSKDVSPSVYQKFLESYLKSKFGNDNLEIIAGYGSSPDILIIKDKEPIGCLVKTKWDYGTNVGVYIKPEFRKFVKLFL